MPESEQAFALPLTAFERYMLADDGADYPMTFAVELHFSGKIERAAWKRSLQEALGRHPLLQSTVGSAAGGNLCWIPAVAAPLDLFWNGAGTIASCSCAAALDLTSRPGLRVCVQEGAERTDVALLFHHACCDGLGALSFIGDVLHAYGRFCGGQGSERRRVEVARLAARGNLGRGDENWPARTLALFTSLPHIVRFLLRHPVPLENPAAAVRACDGGEKASPGLPKIVRHTFDREQTLRLRETAHAAGATLNDLLLRDMFLSIDAWNRRYGGGHGPGGHRPGGRRRGWLKVSMPTNLRRQGDELMPAANMVSHTFITRRASECDDPQSLLAGIAHETASIKRTHRGLCFIRSIEAVQAFCCGRMPQSLLGRRSLATVVLSNLGCIERGLGEDFLALAPSGPITAGNLTLESVTTAPPVRSHTSAAVMAYCYGERLNIGLNCDRNVFSREQSREFLREYVERLEKTAF